MSSAPKWLTPVAVVALLWNLMGCAAYLADVMLKPEDIAKMTAAQQALYAARPAWSVGATAVAVWCGAIGSVALLLRKRWATQLFVLSLLGVIGQDLWLFALSGATAAPMVIGLQGLVLVIAIALVLVSRKADSAGWLA